jgi:uncharacterized protein (TIGR00369 family)
LGSDDFRKEPDVNKQPTSRACFLCGRQNEIGLKMQWNNDPESQQIWADVTVPGWFNSYPGVVHGGIVAALLDETAGRALMLNGDNDRLFITTHLEIKYHHPTPTGQPLRVVGWILRQSERFGKVAAEIRLPDGMVTARCEARVARPPQKFFAETGWDKEAEYWKVVE